MTSIVPPAFWTVALPTTEMGSFVELVMVLVTVPPANAICCTPVARNDPVVITFLLVVSVAVRVLPVWLIFTMLALASPAMSRTPLTRVMESAGVWRIGL